MLLLFFSNSFYMKVLDPKAQSAILTAHEQQQQRKKTQLTGRVCAIIDDAKDLLSSDSTHAELDAILHQLDAVQDTVNFNEDVHQTDSE